MPKEAYASYISIRVVINDVTVSGISCPVVGCQGYLDIMSLRHGGVDEI